MSRFIMPIALPLAMAFAAAAYAGSATSTDDVYPESIWDIHATADAPAVSAGESVAADVYDEAIWDIHAGSDHRQLAERRMEAQTASNQAGAFDRGVGLDRPE